MIEMRVANLNVRYGEAIDRGELEDWVACFTKDALYRAQPRENFDRGLPLATIYCKGEGMLKDRVQAIQSTQVYTPRTVSHLIAWPRVWRTADGQLRASARFVVHQTLPDRPTELLSVGRYEDELAELDGELLFASRVAVFDSNLVPNSLLYPL